MPMGNLAASLAGSRLNWMLAGTYRPGPRMWVSVTTHLGQEMQGSKKTQTPSTMRSMRSMEIVSDCATRFGTV
jgi:hypothetical protein